MGADRAVASGPDTERGGRWRDHREVIDAIAWKFQTGAQWVQLPERYGNWRGVYNRLRMWSADGTWERFFTELVHRACGTGRRRRGAELGRLGGLHDRASPSARGRSPLRSRRIGFRLAETTRRGPVAMTGHRWLWFSVPGQTLRQAQVVTALVQCSKPGLDRNKPSLSSRRHAGAGRGGAGRGAQMARGILSGEVHNSSRGVPGVCRRKSRPTPRIDGPGFRIARSR
ncbi:transposase [Streptomyces sp. NPDC056652]|uniref:transposase n=1 Tax=Streptomyces sp. NPDC056652 TaxID=3345893 RepID=UPI0036AF6F2D